jgi:hypothetical protein
MLIRRFGQAIILTVSGCNKQKTSYFTTDNFVDRTYYSAPCCRYDSFPLPDAINTVQESGNTGRKSIIFIQAVSAETATLYPQFHPESKT